MSQARTNQGGSVVSFVVVGIVLVALVIGGVYMLQHRGGDTPEVAKTNSPAPAPSASSSNSPVPSTSKSPAPSKSAQPTPSSSPKPVPSAAPAPENMPATGPSDILPGGIAAAILLGVTVSYAQSRSARKRALQHQ